MAPNILADTVTDRSVVVALLGEAGIVFAIALCGELLIKILLNPSGDSLAYLGWFIVATFAVFVAYRVVSTVLGSTGEAC